MSKENLKYKHEPIEDVCDFRLPDETISSLCDLGDVLKQINERLKSEGCVIENGQIKNPEQSGNNEKYR